MLENVEASHVAGTSGGRQKAGQNPHRGGFTGAVRPQESNDLALLDFKGNVVHGDSACVSLGQSLYFNHSLVPDKTKTIAIERRAAASWMSVNLHLMYSAVRLSNWDTGYAERGKGAIQRAIRTGAACHFTAELPAGPFV